MFIFLAQNVKKQIGSKLYFAALGRYVAERYRYTGLRAVDLKKVR